jgi:FdhD protein
MDKAIGYALINGIPLNECILYTTGRVPTDMVKKAIMAGVPVLVSKAVPTDAAIKMAKEHSLTLICKAWPDKFEIFAE